MGDFDFNQDTLETFKNFQKLKRKKALQRVGVIGTNIAASIAGKPQVGMPDESDTYKTRDQKIAESTPIIEGMEEREQFYFAEALKDAQKRQDRRSLEMRAVLVAASQHETSTRAAATAGAQMATRRTEKKITETHRDLQNVLNPAKDTLAAVDRVVDSSSAAVAAKYEEQITEILELEKASGADTAELKVTEAKLREDLEGSIASETKQQALAQAAQLMNDMEPAQAAHAMTALLEATGASHSDLPRELANQYNQLSQKAIEERNALEDLSDNLEIEYDREARRTFGDSGPAAELRAQLSAGATERQAARQAIGGGGGGPQEVAGGTTVSEVQEQQQAAGGEAQAPPASPYGETYFNDPNLPKVSGDANQRMEDILDLIEQHPEHPPLQEARNQLLQSADFQKFKDVRGYEDPDVAFREMRRELRAKKQENKRTSERRVSENIQSGQAPSPQGVRARIRKLARPPSTPVQGSVSRTPVEVNTDGKTP